MDGRNDSWIVNPYLHFEGARVYNPLRDRALVPGEAGWTAFEAFRGGAAAAEELIRDGFVVPARADLSRDYHLKIVSLETVTTCNQKCYFCPVSVAPREDEEMPTELFERIVGELTEFRPTLDAVFLQSYNEPTIDRRFVDHCLTLFRAGLPVAVLSNGSGLTPAKIDRLAAGGTMRYLCINLSTLDAERYRRDRGEDHVAVVTRNLEHLRKVPVAQQTRVIVLGSGDDEHRRDFEEIRDRYSDSFEVEQHLTVDRGGWNLEVGRKAEPHRGRLAGCELIGSRPIQHLHITASANCILCCQDYDENYVVGNLKDRSVREVLGGEQMARMRRMAYGVEDAPDDFICRSCAFAIVR